MADQADNADQFIESLTARGLAAVKRQYRGPSRTYCIDCEDVIPHARRAVGGVLRCITCQEILERRIARG